MKRKLTLLFVLALTLCLVLAFSSCGENTDTDTNTETETNTENGSNTDTSTDTSADTETETDSNSEAESDTEINSDTDTESVTDTETETEIESDTESETEIETEDESETETNTENGSNTDTSTDTSADTETETETESNTESDTSTDVESTDTETDTSTDSDTDGDIIEITGVNRNSTTVTLTVGEVKTLIATVTPSDAQKKALVWKSSDTSVVTVSDGALVATGEGVAIITVETTNGKYANCIVTVKAKAPDTIDVTAIVLSQSSVTLEVGSAQNIVATVSPSNATDKTVTWTSSNSDVATVNNGVVSAVGVGTATITAGSSNGLQAICEVTVEEATHGLVFVENEDGYMISGYTGNATALEIPSTYKNKAVNSIGNSAFKGCTSLKTVTIPESVTAIGASAFNSCSNLKSVNIPSDVTVIENYVFYNCSSLESIIIPENITKIGNCAFMSCVSLTEIYYNAKAIDNLSENTQAFDYAGQQSTGISVAIGKEVTFIPAYLFATSYASCCPNIEQITFENGSVCTSIRNNAFYLLKNLVSVENIPSGITYIGEKSFAYCSALTEITIPEDCSYIGKHAFYQCYNVTSIDYKAVALSDFEESNYIFGSVGKDGVGITVNISKNVTKIPNRLFYPLNSAYDVTNIKTVIFEADSACDSIGDFSFGACLALSSITLPDALVSIGYKAFLNCYNLKELTIPSSVTSMGEAMLSGCYSLTSITVPFVGGSLSTTTNDKTTVLGYIFGGSSYDNSYCVNQYYKANYYSQYYFPEALKRVNIIGGKIFYGALRGCTSVTSLTIGESVSSIDTYAFYNCTALTSIIFNATDMTDLSSNNYVFYNAGQSVDGIKVNIGKNVTKIPAYLFCPYSSSSSYSPKITSIDFEEESVCERIGSYAFATCTSLASVTIPDSVTSVGGAAFATCTSLTSVTIPDSVTSIGASAFATCTSLTSVTIGEGVTSIENSAFSDCSKLVEIKFNAIAMNDLKVPTYSSYTNSYSNNCVFMNAGTSGNGISLIIGNKVTKIPRSLFYSYYSFGSYKNAKLTKILFESNSSCTTIGSYAFSHCTSLTSVTIPNSVTSIGIDAFGSSLTSVTFENPNGWYVSTSSSFTTETEISSADLSNTTTAATYLTSTYYNYYWRRNNS
ncbi:MAG: leucine-rich repeat protein [Clostridia bacterium]|nr:leucine-rich repeat protein [Clostridia bacterium]